MKGPLWARVVSTVGHPLLMPLYTLVTLFALNDFLQAHPASFLYFGFILLVNTLGAAISLYLLFRRGFIGDLEIRVRDQRTWPFTLVLAYYSMTLYLVASDRSVHTPPEFVGMLLGVVVSIAGGIVVTRWFKLSMHAMASGGVVGAVFALGQIQFTSHFPILAFWIAAAGLIGASRLALQAHTEREIYAGFLWGALAMYGCVLLSA